MKKTLLTAATIILLFLPIVLAQNESNNQTTNQTSANWYDSYVSGIFSGDTFTLVTVIIGLTLVYIFGKIAFKFIKWAIIILIIILIFKLIF